MDERSLMIKVARLYYEDALNQQEIANREGLSRSKVCRLLDKARSTGIVKISICYPIESLPDLEEGLRKISNLKKAFVVPVHSNDQKTILNDVNRAVASYLEQIVQDDNSIGVSWGNTMYNLCNNLSGVQRNNVEIVQLNGGIAQSEFSTGCNEIIRKFALAFDARPYLLSTPAIVDNKAIVSALLSDTNIRENLSKAEAAEIAIFGIGYPSKESILYKSGYFNKSGFEDLLEGGAVGDICSRYFDINGNICNSELDDRTIGVSLQDIGSKKYSVGIATGTHKAQAILGGMRGNFFNVLFTDEITARHILSLV